MTSLSSTRFSPLQCYLSPRDPLIPIPFVYDVKYGLDYRVNCCESDGQRDLSGHDVE
jgi:hypothetical protein